MNELSRKKVVEHNDLISSIAKMDKTPLKIFELAVSCIDISNPPKDNTVYLSKKELFQFFGVTDTGKHSRFKKAVKEMQKQSFFDIKEKKGDGYEFLSIVPIPTVRWNDYNDEVIIRFNPDIMPYLINLKNNFTQYAISDIMGLNSKHSIVIYRWLCMSYNQFEHYEFKSTRTKMQLEELKNPKITVKELREITDTVDIYSHFPMFDKRIIKESLEEISKNTHFTVSYDKIKKGRSIDSIQFHIEKKKNWNDEEYKRDDETATLSIEQKQEKNDILFAQGIASTYTVKLLTANLITGLDMTNQETVIGLSKHVYPLYDEIVAQYGEKALSDHLGYVSDKMIDYTSSKKNIVKYLAVSAQQYLDNGVGNVVKEKNEQVAKGKTKRSKPVKKAPEWSNANYVDESTEEDKQRFAELQRKMRK